MIGQNPLDNFLYLEAKTPCFGPNWGTKLRNYCTLSNPNPQVVCNLLKIPAMELAAILKLIPQGKKIINLLQSCSDRIEQCCAAYITQGCK